MEPAPFYADVADPPPGGAAYWVRAGDGVRLRLGAFPKEGAQGTVFIFPGRTEYIEKYAFAAKALAARGFASIIIDWRGQGLSDRLAPDPMLGHVSFFSDYQRDVTAALAAAEALDLPRPWHLLAHSMGGCIGLRAVMTGMDVATCAFSGPMWGIQMKDILRPVAWSLGWSSRRIGLGALYAPGQKGVNYVQTEPFETNRLTNDPPMYQAMIDQTARYPELALGGPSIRWLHEALYECRALARLPSPDIPCVTVAGSGEDIVDVPRILDRMDRWPGSHLEMVGGGLHEPLMDTPTMRTYLFDMIADLYNNQRAPSRRGQPPAAAAQAG
ncbi:alpha/beta hydrolase [Roseovarius sp. LXJ103]|nr:alpha/beta hydrolase [Roseovarius carneus]PWE37236.1 alpha/beta hydrolase [Pelagicola sp. LXJ1103]